MRPHGAPWTVGLSPESVTSAQSAAEMLAQRAPGEHRRFGVLVAVSAAERYAQRMGTSLGRVRVDDSLRTGSSDLRSICPESSPETAMWCLAAGILFGAFLGLTIVFSSTQGYGYSVPRSRDRGMDVRPVAESMQRSATGASQETEGTAEGEYAVSGRAEPSAIVPLPQ